MKLFSKDPQVWQKIKPWVFLSTYIMLLGYLLYHLQYVGGAISFLLSLFQSLLYGIIFAYILNLPMMKIERFIVRHTKPTNFIQKKKRPISMFLTFLLALILIVLLANIIVPSIAQSLMQLIKNLSDFFTDIVKNIDATLAYLHIDFRIEDINQVEQFITMPWEKIVSNGINLLSGSASGILSSAGTVLSTFAVGFTGFMFSLYLLSGKESFIRQVRKVIAALFGYDHACVIFRYGHRVNQTFSCFIGGQLTEACILWVLYYVSMRVLGFPFPELICTLIAIFSLIPVFGPMLAMAIGAIMMLSVDPLKSLWFIIFYQLMSQFEDNVIYPRVVGNSVGLPGLWVLLSIFVFGDLFGVLGMVIAVPTTACIYAFFSEFIHDRLKKKKLTVTEDAIYEKEDDQSDQIDS